MRCYIGLDAAHRYGISKVIGPPIDGNCSTPNVQRLSFLFNTLSKAIKASTYVQLRWEFIVLPNNFR